MGKLKEPREEPSQEEPAQQALLEHLLKIEAEAAALVDGAQAEVDHRVSEAERQNRARYEERYSREAAALEAAFRREIEGTKDYYKEELDAYRESLNSIKMDRGRFSALMTAFLTRDS
jgi:regulator of protease activity HflC (stomatin/prohibitin superfamily)